MTREFATKEELFRYLVDNKDHLIAEKKFEMKKADPVDFIVLSVSENGKDDADKAEVSPAELLKKDSIRVKIVINTTKLLDSHEDVHIDGLWKKSLKENKSPYHLQEHKMTFANIISDQVKAYTKTIPWRDLGYDADGITEALVFESEIEKDRNPYMFEQYCKGRVKNHSVGMRYVRLELCVNSKESYYKVEKEAWDKYIGEVINRKDAEDKGYFWAVTEAKFMEGSAVPVGSNFVTPTISIKTAEPPLSTQPTIPGPACPPKKSLFEKLSSIKN